MNYRHGYHAGNFADVFKHLVLIEVLNYLSIKDKPFCYLDTHAGSGLYNLSSEMASKTNEAKTGIHKIADVLQPGFPIFQQYFEILHSYFYPNYYPGSPCIASKLIRNQDRMILSEFHEVEYHQLKSHLQNDDRVAIHHMDGYQTFKAFLPPKEKRGVILVDPPYEAENEWQLILDALKMGFKKFSTGIFLIWYPIKNHYEVDKFIQKALRLNLPNALNIQLSIYPNDAILKLKGSGLLVINAPWQLENALQEWLPVLWQYLAYNHSGSYLIQRLS